MKRRFRLTRSTDFLRVRRFGKSYAGPLFVLIALPNENGELRIGITASHQIGHAVVRNRVKRRLKACFDEMLPLIATGWNIVVVARQSIISAEYNEIRSGISNILKRAGLLVER